ncbi:hypothetical protein VE04_09000 [Pseudogymnoascus sp. 24MN13]|nr:hypothetical protein VE04_09000 [Pseudogymnoascus sp. 24MN13]
MVPGRCAFNTTGLYTVTQLSAHTDLNFVEPSPLGPTYRMISAARLISMSNGGLGGIYYKVNSDINFDEADTTVIYPMGTNPADVLLDLQARGLFFTAFSYTCGSVHGNAGYGQGVVWTQSELAASGRPWDLRAAVETSNGTNLQAEQTYRVYECIMDTPSITGILAQTRLDTMIDSCRGREADERDPAVGMVEVLDVIVTMGGSAWNMSEAPATEPTQGCLAPRACAPWPVILLFVLAAATAAVMGVYWLTLMRAKSLAVKSMQAPISVIDEQTPGDLLTWMQQAVRESVRADLSLKTSYGPFIYYLFQLLVRRRASVSLLLRSISVLSSGEYLPLHIILSVEMF